MVARDCAILLLLAFVGGANAVLSGWNDVTFYPSVGSNSAVRWTDTSQPIATARYAPYCTVISGSGYKNILCRGDKKPDTTEELPLTLAHVGVTRVSSLTEPTLSFNPAAISSSLSYPDFMVMECSSDLRDTWFSTVNPPAYPTGQVPFCTERLQCYRITAGLPKSRFGLKTTLHLDADYYCCTLTRQERPAAGTIPEVISNRTECNRIMPTAPPSNTDVRTISCGSKIFMKETCVTSSQSRPPTFAWTCNYTCGLPCVTSRDSIANTLCSRSNRLSGCTISNDLVHTSQCTQNVFVTQPPFCPNSEVPYILPKTCPTGAYSGCNVTCECPFANGGCPNHAYCNNRGTLHRDPDSRVMTTATSGAFSFGTCMCNPSFSGPTCNRQINGIDCKHGQET